MNGRRERGFWQSPWPWVTGGCCLGCVGLPILFVAVLGAGIFAVFSSTDLFSSAIQALATSPEAVEALGEPITHGWMIQGNVNVDGERGEADMSFPVSGPRGAGRLYLEGTLDDGVWTFHELVLELDDGRRIDVAGTATPPRDDAPEPLPLEAPPGPPNPGP